MNIVEETRQRPEPQRSAQITHLFDDLNDDEQFDLIKNPLTNIVVDFFLYEKINCRNM